ncbi:MAG: hypothetical protein U1E63_16295, partial [Burkholderiales bacterium]
RFRFVMEILEFGIGARSSSAKSAQPTACSSHLQPPPDPSATIVNSVPRHREQHSTPARKAFTIPWNRVHLPLESVFTIPWNPCSPSRGIRTLVPLLAVLAVAMLGEVLDARDDFRSLGQWRWKASLNDVVNTAFWPAVLWILRRTGAVFMDRAGGESEP